MIAGHIYCQCGCPLPGEFADPSVRVRLLRNVFENGIVDSTSETCQKKGVCRVIRWLKRTITARRRATKESVGKIFTCLKKEPPL